MAYAVYWRDGKNEPWKRKNEIVKATRGKLKGTSVARPLKFETLEEAQETSKRLEKLGHETKIKEVK